MLTRNKVKSILKKEKFIFISIAVVLVLFLAIMPVFGIMVNFAQKKGLERKTFFLEKAVEEELERLRIQSEEISADARVRRYIAEKDLLNLFTILGEEKIRRKVGGLLAADEKGIVLARVFSQAHRRGDYIFQTTSWGRMLSQGETVASVEKDAAWPFIMIGASALREGEQVVGVIAAAQFLDEDYAGEFKQRYAGNGTEIIFYSRQKGVSGTSIKDPRIRELALSHFNAGTEWIREGRSDAKIVLGKNNYYVKNIELQGIEHATGGILVLFPQNHALQSAVLSLTLSVTFYLLILYFYILAAAARPAHRHYAAAACLSVVIFIIVFVGQKIELDGKSVRIGDDPFVLYNSTLEFEPEVAIFERAFEQRIGIKLVSGGEYINAIRTVIRYNPALAEVMDIVTANTFCRKDLFIERKIDNKNGEVVISCGLPSPGFSGEGLVGELLLRPLQAGDFSLLFDKETVVLANDGLGTNVLRTATAGYYKAMDRELKPLVVFSPTHPNSERWYNRRFVRFNWYKEPGYEYRYYFGENTVPYDFIGTEEDFTEFNIEKDGEYYFHLSAEQNGRRSIERYLVRIDTEPPLPPEIRVSASEILPGEVVRFDFHSSDAGSGLQKVYYIKINNGIFLPVASPTMIPFVNEGKYTVTIRSYDNADNFSDSHVEITVRGGGRLRDRILPLWFLTRFF